jgi:hypothetical protein
LGLKRDPIVNPPHLLLSAPLWDETVTAVHRNQK